MKKPALHVTDHAIVRYLERVGGFNIEGLRNDIARRCDVAHQLGATSAIIDGHAFLIVDAKVITVIAVQDSCGRQPRRVL